MKDDTLDAASGETTSADYDYAYRILLKWIQVREAAKSSGLGLLIASLGVSFLALYLAYGKFNSFRKYIQSTYQEWINKKDIPKIKTTKSKRTSAGPGRYVILLMSLVLVPNISTVFSSYCCPDGQDPVHCVNGVTSSGDSCKLACGGNCCVDPVTAGGDACVGFTGSVCPDGSCMGQEGEYITFFVIGAFIYLLV